MLGSLPEVEVSEISTLYVPPLSSRALEEEVSPRLTDQNVEVVNAGVGVGTEIGKARDS